MRTPPAPPPTAKASENNAAAESRASMRFQCGSLNESWYIAALANEVKAKRPLGRMIMEEPLVLFRDKEGQVRALIDRCLHRNAMLSKGDVFDGCIGCPYHGWTYDAEGKCVFVPSEGPKVKGRQAEAPAGRAERSVEAFPTREQDGFVWVYMGRRERSADREPFRFPAVGPGWTSYVMLTAFDGDVTDLVENFMDVPHTAYVHGGWFRKQTQPKRAEASVERTADAVLVEYFQPEDSIGFSGRILNPDGSPTVHTDRFYMPNCTRVDYSWGERRAFIITSQITPVAPDRALVYTAITFRLGGLNPIARLLLPWYTRTVIDQDVRIMAVQTANLKRFGGRRFHGTSADGIHRHIEALRDYGLHGEVGAPPGPVSERIAFWM